MSAILHIQIPCQFEDKILIIKSLKLQASGETAEKAFLNCIKNTVYYDGLKTAKIISFKDFKGRILMHIETPFSNTVYDAICDIEPFPGESIKKKQMKNFLTSPTPEEVLKLGY